MQIEVQARETGPKPKPVGQRMVVPVLSMYYTTLLKKQ